MIDSISEIILDDINFFGGFHVHFKKNNESIIRKVYIKNNMKEKRYLFVPDEDIFLVFEKLLQKYHFIDLSEKPSRAGVPDEAHPKIILKFNSGYVKSVWKWINDKNPDFDPFYEDILQNITNIEKKMKPKYDGSFDQSFKFK